MWDTALRELFIEKLNEAYDAEKQILLALPEMIAATENEKLAEGLNKHLSQTQNQVARLEEVATLMGEEIIERHNPVMEALISEGRETLQRGLITEALDAAIIAQSQKIEHDEIATYGTLAAWADELGQKEARDLLHETLKEEEQADKLLSKVAEREVNEEAAEI